MKCQSLFSGENRKNIVNFIDLFIYLFMYLFSYFSEKVRLDILCESAA